MHRFLDVHVLQVLGDEQRQVAVQAQRQTRRRRTPRGVAQRRGFLASAAIDSGAPRARRPMRGGAGGLARLDRGVHEVVLVLQVVGAEAEQRSSWPALGEVGRVGDVEPADAQQRVAHEAAQRLVDRRRRGRCAAQLGAPQWRPGGGDGEGRRGGS